MRLQYDIHSDLNKEFRKLTWFGLIATIMDVITAVTISYAGLVPIVVNILLNTLFFVSGALLGYQLMYYSEYYVHRNRKKSLFIRFNQLLVGLYFALLIFNMFTGCIFSFAEGAYEKGSVYLIIYAVPGYFIICAAVILICNFIRFELWQRISIILFLVFQVSGALLQMLFFPDILLFLFTSGMELEHYQKE